MLFFLHQHFVMPFSLRMYYLLVSSLLRFPSPLPSMSSITDSGYPTLTTPCFKCGLSLAVLHSRFPPFSAQLAPTCLYYPQVLDTTFLSRLSLISTSAKYLPASSRYTISTHCDFFFFSGFTALHPHLPFNLDNENTTVPSFSRLLSSSWHVVTNDIYRRKGRI